MPSLFSRARTASTPSKNKPQLVLPPQSLPASGVRAPALTLGIDEFGAGADPGYGAVGFLPSSYPADLNTPFASGSPPVALSSSTSSAPASLGGGGNTSGTPARPAYGLLSPARDTVLGLPDVARLVSTVCAALERTGVATPFVFSSLALDARRAGVVRLVSAFLTSSSSARAEERWEDETRFAGAHELALCLRWGLSRVVRVEGGRELRGLLSWAWYERWRAEEAANSYPPTAFSTFIDSLPAQLAPILRPLFALCTRLVAHSAASGHTPPSLAAILSPLLFGLSAPPPPSAVPNTGYPTPTSPSGKSASKRDKDREKDKDKERDKDDPESLLFATIEDFAIFGVVYEEYLRGARAAEHLLLACIREDVVAGSASGTLGGPTRLREWVGMYPSNIDGVGTGAAGRPGARRGAKTVRVVHVKRNVRSYSADLVKTGSAWAEAAGAGGGGSNDWGTSKSWRSILAGGAGAPRYTDSYRKRMDFGVGVHPSTSSLSSSTSSTSPPSLSSSLTSPSTTSLGTDETGAGAFRSLTEFQWGAFESLGFGHGAGDGVGGFELTTTSKGREGGIEGRLRFDLTENARAERLAKRETLSWQDFSTAGFSRSDAPLSATLQFAPPLSLGLANTTPGASLNAELTRKLRKAHKALPAFGWDTAPVLGPEEVIEEAFVDVFCDLLYGGGWMERASGVGGPAAELSKECSWALVEYKSRSGGQQDPGMTLVLYEEFVPREYRLGLAGAAPPGTRRRLPSLFTPTVPRGGKSWKQAATLNGRPYVLGATPVVTGSSRDLDFESMLRAQSGTKVISLGTAKNRVPEPVTTHPMARTRSDETGDSSVESTERGGGTPTANKRQSARFRLPGGMIPGPSPGSNGPRVRPGMTPAESAPVEFQTRLAVANESDDEAPPEEEAARQRRRESASDAWVDILVGSVQSRRMGGQDAEMPRGSARRRGGIVGVADPDLASMQVAQALAAETMGRGMSPDPYERGEQETYRDSDVVEIERVPRNSEQSARTEDTDDQGDGASDGYGQPTDDEDGDSMAPGADVHPVLAQARERRRMGYFDIHPERRPASTMTKDDDDPRSLLSGQDSDDDEQEIAQTMPRNLDAIRPLPTPTKPTASPIDPEPKADTPPAGNGHSIAAPKPAAPSKTSALIDMFREREQRATPAAKPMGPVPVPPSRLPVRVASREAALPSVPSPGAPPPKTSPTPPAAPLLPSAPPAAAAPPAAPAKSSPPLLDPTDIEPLDEPRPNTPGRYVHGAPLHNVLEEEEEE